MKKIILTLTIFTFFSARAQTIERFYDWQWKPCEPGLSRFYSVVKNTDSGWFRNDFYTANNKLQMRGLFKDSSCKIKNGNFIYFSANGNASRICRYVNNKLDGLWLSFHNNGMISDSAVYDMGRHKGIELGWYPNGYSRDSTVYSEDGSAVEVYWFDNGIPSAAGKSINDKKEGRWMYFHKNGKTAAVEDYKQDKLLHRTYYDEAGTELADTTNKDRNAEFNGGPEKWKKFLQKKLMFPTGYNLVNTDIITVVVDVIIDEDGKVEDAFIEIPFKAPFDNEALSVLKRSPQWLPAISHNRRVKMYVRQPVTFSQTND